MNKKFTAILVDDEALSLTVISKYLEAYSDIEIIGKFTQSKAALEKIISLKPDLLFLDIQMPKMNGFELLDVLIGKHNPYVIFTTAFNEYAVKAFEVNAIGYLLKPIQQDKLKISIDKFYSFQHSKKEIDIVSQLEKLLKQNIAPNEFLNSIMIKDAKRIFFIDVNEIIYFEANGDYVKVKTFESNYLINDSLTSLEHKLNPTIFSRIHRSHIINSKQLKELQPLFNGEFNVVMKNNEILKLSRNYKEHLTSILKGL